MRDSLKNPLHFVGIRQSAPTVKKKKNFDNSKGTNIHFKLTESANFRVSDVMYGEVLKNNHSQIAIHGIVVLRPRCV